MINLRTWFTEVFTFSFPISCPINLPDVVCRGPLRNSCEFNLQSDIPPCQSTPLPRYAWRVTEGDTLLSPFSSHNRHYAKNSLGASMINTQGDRPWARFQISCNKSGLSPDKAQEVEQVVIEHIKSRVPSEFQGILGFGGWERETSRRTGSLLQNPAGWEAFSAPPPAYSPIRANLATNASDFCGGEIAEPRKRGTRMPKPDLRALIQIHRCKSYDGPSGLHRAIAMHPASAMRTGICNEKFAYSSMRYVNSSITGLVRTSRAMRSTCVRAACASRPSASDKSEVLALADGRNLVEADLAQAL